MLILAPHKTGDLDNCAKDGSFSERRLCLINTGCEAENYHSKLRNQGLPPVPTKDDDTKVFIILTWAKSE